jgi:hypothetical protein
MENDLNISKKDLVATGSHSSKDGVLATVKQGNLPILFELEHLREEARGLRKKFAGTWNAWQSQKQRNAYLEEEIRQLKQREKAWEQERREKDEVIKDLEDKLSSLAEIKDKFQGMIFKVAVKPDRSGNTKKPRGAQVGHRGRSRKNPVIIDVEKEVYLTHCPHCDTPVSQTNACCERIVTDIPAPQAIITKYAIQRQWCGNCKKEVLGIPEGTVPGLRFGITFVSWLLIQKYRMRTPLAKIRELAFTLYRIPISEGGIQKLLGTLKKKLGANYAEILKEIRKSPVKHADETSWRVQGQNHWCWLFSTQKAAYYTIEETRGKGVPKKILEGSPHSSVLVRDDYAGYACIVANHQSCWSHLLRVSHELAVLPAVSKEMTDLHTELSAMFQGLSSLVASRFDEEIRTATHTEYAEKIRAISARSYRCRDSKKVQTRIRNQGKNLITALLFKNVPLTNNHAERQIRPMAVTRKISGGSQSSNGAAIHAVLMSIVQTLSLKGQDIMEALPRILATPSHRYAVVSGKGE